MTPDHLTLAAVMVPDPVVMDPSATVAEARGLLGERDFDALPVVDGRGRAIAVLSWRSLAERPDALSVADASGPVVWRPPSAPLLDSLADIEREPAVVVQAATGPVVGIVTAADLARAFGRLAGPFLVLGEIERRMRAILRSRVHPGFLEAALEKLPGGDREGLEATSLGDAIALWRRFEIAEELGDPELYDRLEAARKTRNAVMHFHRPDPSAEELRALDTLAKNLRER